MDPAASSIQNTNEMDSSWVRIPVGRNSAYDLYLARHLKYAEHVFAHTSTDAIDMFMNKHVEVCASVRQPLEGFAKGRTDVRALPGRSMVINQTIAMPRGRTIALNYISNFAEEMIGSRFISGQPGFSANPIHSGASNPVSTH